MVEEDLKFYEDQKKERKMIFGALDTSYLARTQARDERKIKAKTITSESLPALVSLVDLEEEEHLVDEHQEPDDLAYEEEDELELEPERKKKKSELVPLMVPRDILNNSQLWSCSDDGRDAGRHSQVLQDSRWPRRQSK